MRLSFTNEQQDRISQWLAHVDTSSVDENQEYPSDASTISFGRGRVAVEDDAQTHDLPNHSIHDVGVDDDHDTVSQSLFEDQFELEFESYDSDQEFEEDTGGVGPMTIVQWMNSLSDEGNEIDCVLCRLAVVTQCGHVFHDMCIENHMHTKQMCTHCRTTIEAVENRRIFLN